MTMPVDPTQQVQTAPTPSLTLPTNSPQFQQPANPDQRFTLDDVNAAREAARKEANDRLYPRLEKQDERYKELMEEVNALKSIRQKQEESEAARQAEIETKTKAAADAEKTSLERLEDAQKEWNERYAKLENDNKIKDALLQKEKERSDLMDYRAQRLAAEKEPAVDQSGQRLHNGIAPEFEGYVFGTTREAIDQAIITAQQNTTSILEGIRAAQVAQAANAPGVSVSAGMAPNLTQAPGVREYSAAEIAAMPLDSPELQALRQQHGIGRATPQHGMFG